jgi:CheY-like chemotaxis protein
MTRFNVNLKLDRTSAADALAAREPVFKVLLVGDMVDDRDRYARALQSMGHCTLQATSATAACRLAAELSPDVVVIDISGPRASVELMQLEACGFSQSGVVPVIRLLPASMPEVATRANARYVTVRKPCPPAELATIVSSLASRTRSYIA